jgi:ribose-phosphate pyrophosphokinase
MLNNYVPKFYNSDDFIDINAIVDKYNLRVDFPAGEVGFKIPERVMELLSSNLNWKFHISLGKELCSDVMFISMLVGRVSQKSIPISEKINLFLPYLPFSRDDKELDSYSSYGVGYLMGMLKTYCTVYTLDAHCDLSNLNADSDFIRPMYINVDKNDYAYHYLNYGYDLAVLADKSASRTCDFLKTCGFDFIKNIPQIQALKDRDPSTGKLSNFRFTDESYDVIYNLPAKEENYKVLVIDDICDGGGTFIPIVNNLKEAFSQIDEKIEVDLYVTHGIFSKGTSPLLYTNNENKNFRVVSSSLSDEDRLFRNIMSLYIPRRSKNSDVTNLDYRPLLIL